VGVIPVSDNMIRDKIASAICYERWGEDGEVHHPSKWDEETADAAIAAHLQALTEAGYAVVKLPAAPSEYWGPEHQPQWNHYPYTRVDGDEIEVGARCDHVYRINVYEARILAADLLAAADAAEAQS
jgi:hypothetical protein